jgi:hypothetical protein
VIVLLWLSLTLPEPGEVYKKQHEKRELQRRIDSKNWDERNKIK